MKKLLPIIVILTGLTGPSLAQDSYASATKTTSIQIRNDGSLWVTTLNTLTDTTTGVVFTNNTGTLYTPSNTTTGLPTDVAAEAAVEWTPSVVSAYTASQVSQTQ